MSTLTGENIKLRALEPTDLDFLYNIENNEAYWEVSSTQKPFSRYILKQYIENAHLDIYEAKQIRFAIENNNRQFMGTIDLFDFDPQHLRAGVGILIDQKHQQKGYAKEALNLVNKYAFSNLNLRQLYANIAIDNIKSLDLFKKMGYQLTGIRKDWILSNGKFKDVAFHQLINPQVLHEKNNI